MTQYELFKEAPQEDKTVRHIGYRLYLKFKNIDQTKVALYHNETLVKTADLSDKVAKRLFVIEAIELGAKKSHLAEALNISRQTIHNYMETKKHFGNEGLIHSYNPSNSIKQNRKEHANEILKGNKARQLEQIRKEQREKLQHQTELPFGNQTIDAEDQPFSEQHDWEPTRFAGVFTYLITLIHLNDWLRLTCSFLGDNYKILITFVLMISNNIRSIEQLKNLHSREGGTILGIRQLPGKAKARIWLHNACKLEVARRLLSHYFMQQIRSGIVGFWIWFVDGHLLPYTGKNKVHQAFNTQRDMMVPGRNNIVACDASGRIVDFEIQEGKGDIRANIIGLGKKWKREIADGPVMVFDREAYGAEFFYEMRQAGIEFVTWEKHVDTNKLKDLEEEKFKEQFQINGKTYKVFEGEKQFTHNIDEQNQEIFTLRRIYIWNVSCNRRTCALAYVAVDKMNTQQCAIAILNRWGASENTFKHLGDRHPINYQPGYSFIESQKQEIANPEVKEIKKIVGQIKTQLASLYKKLSKSNEIVNSDGSIRKNSYREKLLSQVKDKEAEIAMFSEQAKNLPERIDLTTLEDYNCFRRICDESKYLFDFVTASIWNVRKQMVEWLLPYFENKDEYIDLFYAITNCHGWIKSEAAKVTVRIEPLRQPSRLAAQQQFCRKLTGLRVITPSGKLLEIEVGGSPIR
jgi:DNA-binding XRE family transcriptional regulator